jgi:hypothetical protein
MSVLVLFSPILRIESQKRSIPRGSGCTRIDDVRSLLPSLGDTTPETARIRSDDARRCLRGLAGQSWRQVVGLMSQYVVGGGCSIESNHKGTDKFLRSGGTITQPSHSLL